MINEHSFLVSCSCWQLTSRRSSPRGSTPTAWKINQSFNCKIVCQGPMLKKYFRGEIYGRIFLKRWLHVTTGFMSLSQKNWWRCGGIHSMKCQFDAKKRCFIIQPKVRRSGVSQMTKSSFVDYWFSKMSCQQTNFQPK